MNQRQLRFRIRHLVNERQHTFTSEGVLAIDRELAHCRSQIVFPKPRQAVATRSADGGLRCRLAPCVAASANEDDQSVQAVLATEDPCFSLDIKTGRTFLEVYLMPGGEWDEQVPLCDSHARDSVAKVLGSVRGIHVEGTRLVGTLCIAATENAVWDKVASRHLTDVSFGVMPLETAVIAPGSARTVNGREFRAPDDQALFVHTAWRLREVSLVAIGADQKAKIRSL